MTLGLLFYCWLLVSAFAENLCQPVYRGADKSLAQPGRKQANVSVRMAWISFGALPCGGGGKLDSSRLDVVEIARVSDMLPSFSFLVGLRTYQHPGNNT